VKRDAAAPCIQCLLSDKDRYRDSSLRGTADYRGVPSFVLRLLTNAEGKCTIADIGIESLIIRIGDDHGPEVKRPNHSK
jgi:hypothetical protein